MAQRGLPFDDADAFGWAEATIELDLRRDGEPIRGRLHVLVSTPHGSDMRVISR